MSSRRPFSMEWNSPYLPKPALLMSRSIAIPLSCVKAKIFSGAAGSAKSAENTCVFISWVAVSRCASASRRSLRRAVSKRLVPPLASSSARATPIPALAPVTSAHLPNHASVPDLFECDKLASRATLERTKWILLLRTQQCILQPRGFALDALHQAPCPDEFDCQQTQAQQDYGRPGTWRKNHENAQEQKSEPSCDQKDAADLLNGAKNHAGSGELSGGEGGIRTHGTVSRTLAFEASTLNRSVTSPHCL